MKLIITERILIPEILPESGDMIEMLLVKSIQGKVELTASEISDWNVRQENDMILWDKEKACDKEIYFENSELTLLKKQVEELDKEKKITSRTIDLCVRIKNNP